MRSGAGQIEIGLIDQPFVSSLAAGLLVVAVLSSARLEVYFGKRFQDRVSLHDVEFTNDYRGARRVGVRAHNVAFNRKLLYLARIAPLMTEVFASNQLRNS